LKLATRSGWRSLPPLTHLSWMLMSTPITALATFVAVYPYLWQDPIGRIRTLINFRESEMANQSVISPQFNVTGTLDAFQRTWNNLHARWSGTRSFLTWIGLPDAGRWFESFDVLLGLVGLAVLLYLGLRKGIQSPQLIVLILIVTEILTVEFSLKTDFERYYLPIVLGFVIAGGSAFGVAVGAVQRWVMSDNDTGSTFSWPLIGRGRQPADQR
ncbi:MAG TPA: hypothetical protein VFQ54_01070, partial [Thermomicrobiales bacterium]|nr:hypothetical protein [Thermomicrobiales bacterium]